MTIKIKSIAFIEPKNENLNIFSKFELPRLGCTILATIMHEKGYASKAYFLTEREILQRNIDTDIIGISTISSTA